MARTKKPPGTKPVRVLRVPQATKRPHVKVPREDEFDDILDVEDKDSTTDTDSIVSLSDNSGKKADLKLTKYHRTTVDVTYAVSSSCSCKMRLLPPFGTVAVYVYQC